MLGLLSGLGKGALDSKYEQKLLQRKRFEEWQKEQMELSSEEKAYISNLPRYQRALELANEKLNAAENALPNPAFSRMTFGDKIRSVVDLGMSKEKRGARNEFARYLEGELLPAIMQIEGLPMTEYSVKSFKEKFDINKLRAKDWRKFFGETKEKLEARALDIQKKVRGLSEAQLSELMQDPQIEKTIKEEATRKLDGQIKNFSEDEVNSLIKLSGNAEMLKEPEEVKKNFLREMGLQMAIGIPAMVLAGALATPYGILAVFSAELLAGLGSSFAGTVGERIIAGDEHYIANSVDDTVEDAPLIAVSHVIAPGLSKILKGVSGRFKPGRELLEHVVSRGFDTAVKDVPNIAVKDVGEFLGSALKSTTDPFEQKVIQGLKKEFSGKSGSYTAEKFADMLSGRRASAKQLAEKFGVSTKEVKDVVSKLEERFLPLRASVSKTSGLLSGAEEALKGGNVRKVAEIFGKLPEKIAIDSGVFTKDQVIKGFLLENSNLLRNKYIKPISSEQLMELASQMSWVNKLTSWAARETLALIGLNGLSDKKIAKLFAQYSFGSAKDPVTKDLMAALQGRIIEEQSGFIAEMLKRAGMSGTQIGMSSAKALTPGAMKWLND